VCQIFEDVGMNKLVTIFAVLVALALPLAALAQTDQEKDVLEVGVSGGLSIPAGGASSFQDSLGGKVGFNVAVDCGYFLTPDLTLGGAIAFHQLGVKQISSIDNNQHNRVYVPTVYLKYHFFGNSNFVPYVKANVGAIFMKYSTLVEDHGNWKFREIGYHPGLAMGLGGGAFYYTSDYSGIFLEANFLEGFTKSVSHEYGGKTYSFGKNVTMLDIRAGIQVFFGSK
jgi:hypothetical protein